MWMINRAQVVSALLALSTLLTSCSIGAAGGRANPVARFRWTSCPAVLSSGVDVRCGALIVPQNRAEPNGRTIRVAVAVFKSSADKRSADPVLVLMGGPGDPAIGGIGKAITPASESFILGDRDLIVIDYRGVGYSNPALSCPQVRKVSQMPLAIQRNGIAAGLAVMRGEYRRCRDALIRRGIEPGAYTTSQIAADVADLRTALGYKEINLYAVSYGTRVALSMMRDHPRGIRSVVLDSVLPPQVDDALMLRRPASAFATLFAGCAAAAACHAAYPHLAPEFYRLVSRLQSRPVVVRAGSAPPLLLTGSMLAQVVYLGMYSPSNISVLPRMIHELARGRMGTLTSILSAVRGEGQGRSTGLAESVNCSENVETNTVQQIERALRTVPSWLRGDTTREETASRSICALWGVRAVAAREKTAVHSSIPTLILDGQLDPVTPSAYGALVRQTLRHAFRFVFPGLSHAVRYDASCVNDITQAFLDNPILRPDGSCIGSMPPAF